MIGRYRLLTACALALLVFSVAAGHVHAQSTPEPDRGITGLLSDPSKWATTIFNDALKGVGHQMTRQAIEALRSLIGGGDILSKTPPELSYENEVVRRLWQTVKNAANGGLVFVTIWGGFNLIVHPHIRAPYHGALELIPRLLVGAVLVNTSLDWGRFAIDVNNALCAALGPAIMPTQWSSLNSTDPSRTLMDLIALGVYAVMGFLLGGQMLMRIALVDALLVISPIALLCWVVPQTYAWARLWLNTFFGTIFVQFVQVAVLQLGSGLMERLVTLVPGIVSDPVAGTGNWIGSLLMGIAVLQLARKVPRLMPGTGGGGGAAMNSLGTIATRHVLSFVSRNPSRSR
jgi:hypothetical protein